MTPLDRHRDWRGCLAVLRDAQLEGRPAAQIASLERVAAEAEAALWEGGEVEAPARSTERRARLPNVKRDAFWMSFDERHDAIGRDVVDAKGRILDRYISPEHAAWAAERRRAWKRRPPIDWLAWNNSGAAASRPWGRRSAFSDLARTVGEMREPHTLYMNPENYRRLVEQARRIEEQARLERAASPRRGERYDEVWIDETSDTSLSHLADAIAYLDAPARHRPGNVIAQVMAETALAHLGRADVDVVADPNCPSDEVHVRQGGHYLGSIPMGRRAAPAPASDVAAPRARGRSDLFNDGRSWTTTLIPTTSQGDDHADR